MSVIAVPRLRLMDPAVLDEFFAATVSARMSSPGLTTPGGQASPAANAARLPSRLRSSDRRR
jgi:hypothetical protein